MAREQHLPLEGKIALVTGSSQGIGRAVALRLAQAGADVAVNYYRHAEAAEEVRAQIEALGRRAIMVQADVSQEEDVSRLFEQINRELGPVTVLVNNAGTTRDKLILQMSLADFEDILNINLRSAFLCTRAALRSMMKARWGRIVNVTSVAGLLGNAGQANYSASKAALIALTLSTAREMASRNITANAVAPGFVPTELTSKLTEQQRKQMLDLTPLGRFGTPEEVAATICFLCSPEAGYITGQVICVDGGMAMHI
ncbi:MAG: 3-oxoacyl-[acyl-carrier-protein] reductase [Thermogemmatispora sp.]|jgi:3-oxoacyl-[acyl-carrier protein] reductase|uniref:3-oxoacyl-[acyl-carrier-protein] reductase n=1 Tax=Thermogemmatispora sp. TaxID=1968838 RepID=UPI001A09C593|nr:3-oxoacyl-[acyl-carrier-protein] reductase [Thermogemmatispora sp.]MBE3567745.1 3-oxoacyl-[acyl-carrier-protein] reductase [Thermogemmatispora sp.]